MILSGRLIVLVQSSPEESRMASGKKVVIMGDELFNTHCPDCDVKFDVPVRCIGAGNTGLCVTCEAKPKWFVKCVYFDSAEFVITGSQHNYRFTMAKEDALHHLGYTIVKSVQVVDSTGVVAFEATKNV